LESQTNGIKHSKEEAFVDARAQGIATAVEGERSKDGEERSTALQFEPAEVTPSVMEAAPQTVSPYAFDRMIAEFSELSNVMGSIASLIIRDHVRACGESMEEFPRARFPELVESLSKTISDNKLKADFCQRFARV
jgi:hypothetical protein